MKALPSIAEEFAGCELGDQRLLDRAIKLAAAFERDPERSIPEAVGGRAALEAAYRFFSNDRFELADLVAGHIDQTVERMRGRGECLAIHDTTDLTFRRRRRNLGFVRDKRQGFYVHTCLAVSADGGREPLGLLALDAWRRETKKGIRSIDKRTREAGLESERWLAQSRQVDERVGSVSRVIHVEDREGDIYKSLRARVDEGARFIVRANAGRVIVTDDGLQNVLEALREAPRLFSREVSISRRRESTTLPDHKRKKPREKRNAVLAVAAQRVSLRRPKRLWRSAKTLELNAVHVREVGAVEEPVEWLLFTTEPIATREDIEFVIDSYRARWLIEEYFRALKTGCAFESRQLEDGDSLLRALGIFAVLAWRLLVLRHQERLDVSRPATAVASESEIAVLRAKKLLQARPTASQFIAAVARLGGHIPNNGPPGYLVLWRGMSELQLLAQGWALAREKM